METNRTTMPASAVERERNRWKVRDVLQILFFALFIRPLMKFVIGCRVYGQERLPLSGPFVLIANHSSHLDTASLLSLFPLHRLRTIHPVAAADYFTRNRAISWFSHTFFNILSIERRRIPSETNPVNQMIAALREGKSLILFPEGTRGCGESVGEFRAGIAHLVEAMPDLKIVPAYLKNTGKCLPKGTFLPVPLFCEVRVGESGRFDGDRREILDRLRAAVCELGERNDSQPAN